MVFRTLTSPPDSIHDSGSDLEPHLVVVTVRAIVRLIHSDVIYQTADILLFNAVSQVPSQNCQTYTDQVSKHALHLLLVFLSVYHSSFYQAWSGISS